MANKSHQESSEVKERILKAAFKLFSERGFDSTGVAHIAKLAKVSRSSIYWHFFNKETLLCELCSYLSERGSVFTLLKQAAEPTTQDPMSLIKQWVLLHTQNEVLELMEKKGVSFVESAALQFDSNETLRQEFAALIALRHERLKSALKNAVIKGQLPDKINLNVAASYINTLLFGYIDFVRLGNKTHPFLNEEKACDVIFESLKNF